MKVAELIEFLQDLDSESVVKFRDADGDYHEIDDVEGDVYVVGDEPEDDDEEADDAEPIVVLTA